MFTAAGQGAEPEAGEVAMSLRLVVIAGPDQGKVFALSGPESVCFGRSRAAAARLADPGVSRSHCEVKLAAGRATVIDLASTAGTFVNGARVREQVLQPGDVLQVGATQLRLESGDLADEVTLAPPEKAAGPRLRAEQAATIDYRPTLPALPAERLHELSGRTISHYVLGPVLAQGRSGILFKAHDTKHERVTAFKILWPQLMRDDDEMRRFVRAMRTIMPLRHANLVSLYGAGRARPYCWLALEYVEGQSLAQVLGSGSRPPSWRLALHVLAGVARALAFAHARQVLHRNVTPPSILLRTGDRTVKLGDLMLAKALASEDADKVTRPGEVLGDVLYMAPERTTGQPEAGDGRADLYSLGATAYCLLTGRPPLQGASFVQTVLKIRAEAPRPPRELQPRVPARLEKIVLQLLAKEPKDRFATAQALLQALKPLLESAQDS
jgi:hypothetical protein